ncbi:MAG: ribosome-associated translation inhibitor RaiA [Defluviitaleaceae bacterium]|nr:ribosome-associated translation inhibitor RaiA [Defluviitaleaceae bacterium]MCL2263072.1 ribosome-associated translation inhibitor RaiA [Defluviitaleaceae bacterium]
MRYVFTGKNMSVTEGIKERATRKLGRLEKFLPEGAEVYITFSESKHLTKMEVSVPMHKRILRAEVSDEDVSSCIDQAIDILERQVVKYKSRLRDRQRRSVATSDELTFIDKQEASDTDKEITITRTKKFALKPMDAQEAVMEMELLHHNFYVFRNSWSDEVNVVYRRNDGEYGLIEPQ